MDNEIRWSSSKHQDSRFVIVDAANSCIRHCEADRASEKIVSYHELAQFDREFTAFDWSPSNDNLIALCNSHGEANILQLERIPAGYQYASSFQVKQQRKCTAIAFSHRNLLAVGLTRHRTDSGLYVHDIETSTAGGEAYRRLDYADAVTEIKCFRDMPETLLAGIHSKGIRLHDLRDPNTTAGQLITTPYFDCLAIDTTDENYFASAGSTGESVISIWDRRNISRSAGGSLSSAPGPTTPVFDIQSQAGIKSLKFCELEQGRLTALSHTGQLRLFDIGRHDSADVTDDNYNSHGMDTYQPTKAPFYLKRSHDLRLKQRITDNPARAVSFDFPPNSFVQPDSIVSLRRDGAIEIIRTSQGPAVVKLSPGGVFLQAQSKACTCAPFHRGTIAEDLLHLQRRARTRLKERASPSSGSLVDRDSEDAAEPLSVIHEEDAHLTSRQRHEKLLAFGFPELCLPLPEMLTVAATQRRRCEEGYLFNCTNNKRILCNDAWLVGLWDVVGRLENIANDLNDSKDNFDLSYAGVHSIWAADVPPRERSRHGRQGSDSASSIDTILQKFIERNEYDTFTETETAYPARRTFGLILCGWRFETDRLQTKCVDLVTQNQAYKAIVLAFFHGQKKIAIEMLRLAMRRNLLQNSGLAAIITCETISADQRELCEWLAEEAKDPYLKALLTYFISGDWRSVANMAQLPLKYRVAVALQYLDDDELTHFLDSVTADCIAYGDIEGILLTGLGQASLNLFQNYIDRTADLQTAILAFGISAPTAPLWLSWKEAYFHNMQEWEAFIPRTRFTVQYSRRAAAHNPHKRVGIPSRQITLRCMHCQQSIARPEPITIKPNNQLAAADGTKQSQPSGLSLLANRPAPSPAAAAGTVCPRCSRHLPRCSLCMLWLSAGAPPASGDAAVGVSGFINFCIECGHGYHASCARSWHSKHKRSCAMPDCRCMCAVR